MKKRLLSIILTLSMIMTLFPGAAMAVETGGEQIIGLPVIEEGEKAPEPQGAAGKAGLLELVGNVAGANYNYQGSSEFRISGEVKILDPATMEPVEENAKPAGNGVLQMLDAQGKVVATSEAISYYHSEYEYTTDENGYSKRQFHYYYISYTYFYTNDTQDMKTVQPGTYSLQLVTGSTAADIYPCSGSVIVVSSDDLLIRSAYAAGFYVGKSTFSVNMNLYGFEKVEELDDLSFTLTEVATGKTVASSSGNYRDVDVSYHYGAPYWYLYAEMTTIDGYTILEDTEYQLQVHYTGQGDLYDGVGAMSREAYTSSVDLESMEILDPQTGLAEVTFASWDSTKIYRVEIHDNENLVIGKYQGKIPETGVVEIQMNRNGIQVPVSTYGYNFQVYVYRDGNSHSSDNLYVNNPYYNMDISNGYCYINPYYISSSNSSYEFLMYGYNFAAFKDGKNVITLQNKSGEVVATCSDPVIEFYNGERFDLSGTLTFSSVVADGTYYAYLNGIQCDTVRVTSGLSMSWDFPMQTELNGEAIFYTNFGICPISMEGVNSSGKGQIVIRDENGNTVLSSGMLTGTTGEYPDYRYYRHNFTVQELSALTSGSKYSFAFVDANGQTRKFSNLYTYSTDKTEIDLTNTTQCYPEMYDCEVGDQTIPVRIRVGDGKVRNVTKDDLNAVTGITLSNTDTNETFNVTGWSNLRNENNSSYYLYLDLNLDASLTAGMYEFYYKGARIYTSRISDPDEENENKYPYFYTSSNSFQAGYLIGNNLAEGVYTATVHRGFESMLDEPLSLTLKTNNEEDNDQLYFDKDLLRHLEPGKYEIRISLDGKLVGSTDLTIPDTDNVLVEICDVYESEYDPINYSGMYHFNVYNGGTYTKLRAAESLDELASAKYYELSSRGTSTTYHLSDGEGEKTIYVQLLDADGVTTSEVLTFTFWRLGEDGMVDIYVPEDLQGIYSSQYIDFTVGAETNCVQTWMEVVDSNGVIGKMQLNYDGRDSLPNLYPETVHGLESPHPIQSGDDIHKTYTVKGAEYIAVTFSPLTALSYNSWLDIYAGTDATGTLFESYEYYEVSRKLAGQTIIIPGDSIYIHLRTADSSYYFEPSYGFAITDIRDANEESTEIPEDAKHLFSSGNLVVSDNYVGNIQLENAETVRFYLTNSDGDVISEKVERMLIFGNPDSVILPQFRDYSSVYSTSGNFTLYGYTTPNSTVTVTISNKAVGTGTANSYGYFSIELTDLKEGYNYFTVADDSGETDSVTETLIVDTKIPAISNLSFNYSDTGTATLIWEISDSDIDYFSIYKNGTMLDNHVSYDDRTYTVTAMPNDGNVFTVQVYDRAGNMSQRTVSTWIEIWRDDVELVDMDAIVVPESGSVTYTYTAKEFDQHGVDYDIEDVVWTIQGNDSGATVTDNGTTLTVTVPAGARGGSIHLIAEANGNATSLSINVTEPNDLGVDVVSFDATGATVAVYNNTSTAMPVTAMLAAYDANGKMIAADFTSITMVYRTSFEMAVSYDASDAVSYIKVFLLDRSTGTPLMDEIRF